jgi:hypothetical protein
VLRCTCKRGALHALLDLVGQLDLNQLAQLLGPDGMPPLRVRVRQPEELATRGSLAHRPPTRRAGAVLLRRGPGQLPHVLGRCRAEHVDQLLCRVANHPAQSVALRPWKAAVGELLRAIPTSAVRQRPHSRHSRSDGVRSTCALGGDVNKRTTMQMAVLTRCGRGHTGKLPGNSPSPPVEMIHAASDR